jgi:type I restriction enzyme S subunit
MGRHQSYKPSNVEWIGDIPSHWSIIKTNIITKNLDGKRIPLNSEERGNMEGDYPYWGSNGIVDYINNFIFNEEIVLVGEDGSPFFDKLRDVSFYVNEPVWVNNHIHILKPKNKILPKFLTHSFNCVDYKEFITGSTRDKLTQSDLKRIPHCVPPIHEQEQIVKYLDEKTSIIDKLISNKERKIELLKVQRTSLINEVITKGLNPNVKMKDSGVEWIGEIPEHWKNVNFGRICSVRQGLQIPYEDRFFEKVENSYQYITTKSVHNPEQQKQFILNPKSNVICNENDILMGRTGNTGEVVTNVNGVFHNNFFLIDFNRKIINKEFLVWYLSNSRLKEELLLLSGTTTIPDLNHGKFLSTKFVYPSIEEQQEIVDYLNKQTKEIDDLVSIEQRKIELLKEYRQSLISEVITGKIKVVE